MKTPCFTLGLLLLLTVCCCDAMPQEVPDSGGPYTCCHSFYEKPLPLRFVTSITKTDPRCPEQGFILQTVKNQICFSQTSPWALDVYKSINT
ncbi:C-C motif chemokine 3-like [Limanda limanda]|uniref:C-C motif chemokine 3-like n=1 Tax=Limanda limanda TaxID=27771 RepID=UPI0029C8855E|nr:C-C motif chemokine 3-like [Limanda limanda]